MHDIALRHMLNGATLFQLRDVIDWLDRPWAGARNEILRAAYHHARRDRTKRPDLAQLLDYEIYGLDYQRDLPFVAHKLGIVATGPQSVADEVRRRLHPLGRAAWSVPPEIVASGMQILAETLRHAITASSNAAPAPPSGGHGRRRGRRR